MKKKKHSPLGLQFAAGPLTEAEKRIEDFSYNLYFSYVFDQTVHQHQQLQDDYIEAFLNQDDEKMRAINRELTIVEAAFETTANMIDAVEEGYS
tara:strand:- start:3565 stop:3846 length:282 start_codon:yes stop_codon:yes gene_type:complete